MSFFEVRLSSAGTDEEGRKQVSVEFWGSPPALASLPQQPSATEALPSAPPEEPESSLLTPLELKSAVLIVDSTKDGLYDTVTNPPDLNLDGRRNSTDRLILLLLANAFAQIDPEPYL